MTAPVTSRSLDIPQEQTGCCLVYAGSSSRTASAAEAQLRRLSTESEPPSPSANPPEEQLAEAASAPSALPEQAALPDGLTDDQVC